MLYKSERTAAIIDQGPFVVYVNMPGRNWPEHDDYGYAALVAVAESYIVPGTHIGMHPHVQDEIISYVPPGVMRHADRLRGALVADPEHLMVMNAGSGFWHEERTLATDPPLRMLQKGCARLFAGMSRSRRSRNGRVWVGKGIWTRCDRDAQAMRGNDRRRKVHVDRRVVRAIALASSLRLCVILPKCASRYCGAQALTSIGAAARQAATRLCQQDNH